MSELRNGLRASASAKTGLANRARPRGAGVRTNVSSPTTPTMAGAPESIFRLLWHSRWIMLVCLILAFTAGLVYIQMTVPIYRSTSRLYLDYASISTSQSYEPGRMPRTDRYLHTQAELLVSRPILGAVCEAMEAQRLRTLENVDVPVAYLRRNLRVAVGRRDEILSVSFDSPYPHEAAQIVNQVVQAYMASRSDHERKNSSQVLEMLQGEMTRATAELDKKRDALEEFQATGMPLALGSDQSNGVVPRYLALQTTLTEWQTKTLEAQSFLRGVQMLADDSEALRQYLAANSRISVYAGSSRDRTPLEADRVRAQRRRENLLEELTPGHPEIVKAEAEIERITASLRELDTRFVNAALATAEQQYRESKDEEEKVAKLYEEQRKKVVALNAEIARYRRLDAEVAELASHCQTVQQQIRDIRTIAGEDIGQLRMEILEAALVPRKPSEPQKTRVMALALALGLLAGGGVAVCRDLLDQTLQSGDEISALLGLPVLGVVPAMSRRQKIPMRGQRVHLQPDSPEAEAFRTVRTAIFFGVRKEKARTMLITSPASGDGKSTLVSNLAIAMAQAGQRTILLDADFRRPMQHVIFSLDHDEGGLGAVLTGKMKLGQAIQATPVKGLSVLTGGPKISNPSEILNSRRFTALLEHLAKVYDRVIIDAPPVTVVTDAQILGAICDVTVLVLRAHKSTRKIGQRALGSLRSVGAHLLGVVVNDVRRSGDSYGYYGNYGGSNGTRRSDERAVPAPQPARSGGTKPAVVKMPSPRAKLGGSSC